MALPETICELSAESVPPWALWLLNHQQVGVLVLNGAGCVAFANRWVLDRVEPRDVVGRCLTQVFPAIEGSYFQRTVQRSQATGFPSVMCHSLHAALLPVYMPQRVGQPEGLLRTTVHVIPMERGAAAATGQRYTLIQITDVTSTVRREVVLRSQVDQMHHMARVDALTGIGNRREFDEALDTEVRAALRTHTPLGLLMVDIDHFKNYNDHYGHQAGDQCLREVAHVLRRVVRRPRDRLARYGGEEMAVLLPSTPLQGVQELGREIVQQVMALGLPHAANPLGPVLTVSAGGAVLVPAGLDDGAVLVQQADKALYAAKNAGRNRLFLAADGLAPQPVT